MAGQLVAGADGVRRSGRRDSRGMTTAEYAVGTVATVSFVGIILAIINNGEFQGLIWKLVQLLFKLVMQAMGGGV
ncbi:MAG: DUF4244 domain-containing protein [Propionicimonas sp.]|uniref:DUF4244 domain-containing protein n=1 Tax=Propionicimonas sp. TaxID=1955623 RepID=UPI003D0AF1C7